MTMERKKNASTTRNAIKCVVWDLDQTLWDGILIEDQQVTLRPEIPTIIQALDNRGILNSIASKNDAPMALAKLEELGIRKYFLYPQINWNAKSSSIKEIAHLLNIGTDAFAFIDDQAFERDEVAHTFPEIRCLDLNSLPVLLTLPEMNPRFLTADAGYRRMMYMRDIERHNEEQSFVGTNTDFLETLQMVCTIVLATESDLQRAEELTVRTHQLNTTGYTYSYEELNTFRQSEQHLLFVVGLDDKYGSYGKIGLALLACSPDIWTIRLLLISCRVMTRGIGTILINYLIRRAQQAKVRLQLEFMSNDRNRMMLITCKFGGFKVVKQEGPFMLFEHDSTLTPTFSPYVQVHDSKY